MTKIANIKNGLIPASQISLNGGGVLSNLIEYSTQEKVIGKWIDGKPLYRMVHEYTPTAQRDRVYLPIYNVNALVGITGIYYRPDSRANSMINTYNGFESAIYDFYCGEGQFAYSYWFTDSAWNYAGNPSKIQVILEYTKL